MAGFFKAILQWLSSPALKQQLVHSLNSLFSTLNLSNSAGNLTLLGGRHFCSYLDSAVYFAAVISYKEMAKGKRAPSPESSVHDDEDIDEFQEDDDLEEFDDEEGFDEAEDGEDEDGDMDDDNEGGDEGVEEGGEEPMDEEDGQDEGEDGDGMEDVEEDEVIYDNGEDEESDDERKELKKKLQDKKMGKEPVNREAIEEKYRKLKKMRPSKVKGRERRIKILDKYIFPK